MLAMFCCLQWIAHMVMSWENLKMADQLTQVIDSLHPHYRRFSHHYSTLDMFYLATITITL